MPHIPITCPVCDPHEKDPDVMKGDFWPYVIHDYLKLNRSRCKRCKQGTIYEVGCKCEYCTAAKKPPSGATNNDSKDLPQMEGR